jgi:hypothetical protein
MDGAAGVVTIKAGEGTTGIGGGVVIEGGDVTGSALSSGSVSLSGMA